MTSGSVELQVARLFLHYRVMPQSTTRVSPAELMFGRDLLLPNLANHVSKTATSKIMMLIPNKEILRYVGM